MKIQLLRADRTSMKVDVMVSAARASDAAGSANLLTAFVIKTDAPAPDEHDADVRLRAATTYALQRAEELAVSSVGIPPMWISPLDVERCARIMLRAAIDYRPRVRSLQRVVFCIFGKETYEAFERVLRELEP